jgi:hypothetical protein
MSVRYYVRRPGQRVEDLTPAGTVQVEPAVLAWRSTVPEKAPTLELREGRAAEQAPRTLRAARSVGVGLVLLAIAPAVLWGAARARAAFERRERRPSARATRGETREALKSLRTLDLGGATERRDAYARLNTVLRKHVADTAGVPELTLTPEQLAMRLRQTRTRLDADAVSRILAECDVARYGPADLLPPSDRFLESVEATERLL